MKNKNPNSKVKVVRPTSIWLKPVKADLKDLFKALAKGVGHTATGKWAEIASDTVEALASIGLQTDPGELGFLLIRRSLIRAVFDLVGESSNLFAEEAQKDADKLTNELDFSIELHEVEIDKRFFDRPSELVLLPRVENLVVEWLVGIGLTEAAAHAVASRIPSYFVHNLNREWRSNAKSYRPLEEALDTAFASAGEREWAWAEYGALLERRIHESVFDEPFSLSQIYVPLNATYPIDPPHRDYGDEPLQPASTRQYVVVSLDQELKSWLRDASGLDAVRVLSGGPGSGKSSFARVFAAQIMSQVQKIKVLFVPLHLIDPSKDIVEEVGRFVREEGVLLRNPLDPDSPEPNLLIIFDGLDELSSQGKAAAETARLFVREVEKVTERRNHQEVKLRVLLSGRELIVQENESEFRRPRQILTLLPYFVEIKDSKDNQQITSDDIRYLDTDNLLKRDLRQVWWKNYGVLTGKLFTGIPNELKRSDLEEITSQPLLNYLVALSFTRDKLDFTKNINLNSIYEDLVAAVHERGYEKHRPYGPIRHMSLENFSRVLEEIGLAAWHGDGRTTTVQEIEAHCRASGVGGLLDIFQEGAKAGVTRLLAAFFFRQYGRRTSGDPTFVFTHKSFGEYLAARRLLRATERVIRELSRRSNNPDEGWDERDALKHWAQICGPSAISKYLHTFLVNEFELRPKLTLKSWQNTLARLFSYVLKYGFPMEQIPLNSFRDALFQARNSEETLLVSLNLCARVTKEISGIEHPDRTAFGAWLRRLQGQRISAESVLTLDSMSYLNLSNISLDIADLYGANLESSNLAETSLHFTCLINSSLIGANLYHAILYGANMERSRLDYANLQGALLRTARLNEASLTGANLEGVNSRAYGRIDEGVSFQRADLSGAKLRGAVLQDSDFRAASLIRADLTDTDLRSANLRKANLTEAVCERTDFRKSDLRQASFHGAIITNSKLSSFITKQISKKSPNGV